MGQAEQNLLCRGCDGDCLLFDVQPLVYGRYGTPGHAKERPA